METAEAELGAMRPACGAKGADSFAWPRSPMMTASGIAAEGLPVDVNTRRIAAESVSPQHLAVFGTDTELRLAVIPVISFM